MSDIVNFAIAAINEKLGDNAISGSVKLDMGDDGSVFVDENGASASDAEADCTLIADSETLKGILTGDIDPTSAVMSGQLTIEGDMGLAMSLGNALA